MIILGIETSCDETAAAVVKNGRNILSTVVASSLQMHAKSGGIIPEKAAREQLKSILPVIQEALNQALSDKPAREYTKYIDAIAVTVGPGLVGSLLVGVETAKTLAHVWKKPIIPVNHLVAHIYANWLSPNSKVKIPASPAGRQNSKSPEFPALALVVSGGHTDLVLMKGYGKLEWLGGTRDDAAGETFDKCARLLGLPYPGGPAIADAAANYQLLTINHQPLKMFPRPMIDKDNFDFSFSGLKTAVFREIQNPKKLDKERLAAEVQEAIVDVLVTKTLRAVKKFRPKSLLLAGGVAANLRLREKFKLEIRNLSLEIDFRVPSPTLCTDNAAYIAAYAFYNYLPSNLERVATNPELTIVGQP